MLADFLTDGTAARHGCQDFAHLATGRWMLNQGGCRTAAGNIPVPGAATTAFRASRASARITSLGTLTRVARFPPANAARTRTAESSARYSKRLNGERPRYGRLCLRIQAWHQARDFFFGQFNTHFLMLVIGQQQIYGLRGLRHWRRRQRGWRARHAWPDTPAPRRQHRCAWRDRPGFRAATDFQNVERMARIKTIAA